MVRKGSRCENPSGLDAKTRAKEASTGVNATFRRKERSHSDAGRHRAQGRHLPPGHGRSRPRHPGSHAFQQRVLI